MKKILSLILTIFFLFQNNSIANEKIINLLKEGNKLIFIRHAYAPGNGDPKNFSLKNCSTQRNLNQEGIKQAEKIGLFFDTNKIIIGKILSSEWCRCKDTSKVAFNSYETFNALNSFYEERFSKNKDKQIKDLKNYIHNLKEDKNVIFVTHYVVIYEILNTSSLSGEIIVTDKNLKILGRMNTNN